MYEVIDIPLLASETLEQVGSKDKFWYAEHSKMFKLGRPGTGEHWAEKVAAEACELLELPHAQYEFARYDGVVGVTTNNIVSEEARLVLGNEVLPSFSADYDGAQTFRARQHTVGRVAAALGDHLALPAQCPAGFPLTTAKDVFSGYLLLDAWIGNTDRHHENWGLINEGGVVRLAPTFDHASSLGRELTDASRIARLAGADPRKDVLTYAGKAASGFYRTESEKAPLLCVDAFREFAKKAPDGAQYWLNKLGGITPQQVQEIFANVPAELMSDPARQFAKRLMTLNRAKLLGEE